MQKFISTLIFLTFMVQANENEKNIYIVNFKQPVLTLNKEVFNNKNLLTKYINSNKQQHRKTLNSFNKHFNKSQKPLFEYHIALNAMSIELSIIEAEFLKKQDNVLKVTKQYYMHISTDASASMINADQLWSGNAITPLDGVKGEDVIIAVIDSGINMGHTSFSDMSEDNYDFASHYTGEPIGWCNPSHSNYDSTYICNNKLIGAWDFIDIMGNEDDGPIDSNFHGSHIAGIISGNYISMPEEGFVPFVGDTLYAPFISGIAPHSHIISYDVCDSVDGCPSSAILAAIEQAILDDVDIINLSLEGNINPWEEDSVAMALLNANNLGIITATPAGNATNKEPNTYALVNNISPWVITTANTYHGRTRSNDITIINSLSVPDFLQDIYALIANGLTIIANIEAKVIYGKNSNITNEDGCRKWKHTDFASSVVLIKSGNCSNQVKIDNAADKNASAVIIYNENESLPTVITDIVTHTIPVLMIGQNDADLMINYIQSNKPSYTMLEILAETKHKIVDTLGMTLYCSSLRGPNNQFDITKPDISAPGTNIFSAILDSGPAEEQYFAARGTSQATAVISGSLALLKNVRPTWSPSELKSSLMLTANTSGISFEEQSTANCNGNSDRPQGLTTVDDTGSGLADISKAANTVLVMHESPINYLDANPDTGGHPKDLNLASMRDNNCNSTCNWTRTFTNKGMATHSWDVNTDTDDNSEIIVSDSNFTLAPGASFELSIEYNKLAGDDNEHRYGILTLSDTDNELPVSNLSIVVFLTPSESTFNNRFNTFK